MFLKSPAGGRLPGEGGADPSALRERALEGRCRVLAGPRPRWRILMSSRWKALTLESLFI